MKRPCIRRRTGFGLTDLLVVAVLIPLVLVLLVGCWRQTRGETSVRLRCAGNLKSIGQAMMLYANENRGAFPRARFVGGATVIPTWGTGAATTSPFAENGPGPNDVTAALYLLLTTQDITSEVFVCPRSNAEKWDFGGGANDARNWSNWNGRDGILNNLSYSMQNPYPDDAAVESGFKWNSEVGAEFALAADMNPGTKGSGENVLAVTPTDDARKMRQANSPHHNYDGQNILYGDGHVQFENTPFAGINKDNIYTRSAGTEDRKGASVVDSSLNAMDNVLLPTND